jgi:catechol 2,3-dioxygenase-like lactoylglutathione lyase family enzyme
MLSSKNAIANIATKNISVAKEFYQETLGLTVTGNTGEHLFSFKSGNSIIWIYQSDFAGTNKATSLSWMVGDELEAIVADLKGKGVTFEHYDMPQMKLEGDIHVGGGMKIAWFKDPDGNILSMTSGSLEG